MSKNQKGFTLIELLVVVSIISLLASVVFASLNSARGKAKDAAIKSEVQQLQVLAEQNYNDYGSYSNLQPALWYPGNAACGGSLAGTYATQATAICQNILSNEVSSVTSALFFGNSSSLSAKFSFMAYLPYKQTYYCIGSSGANSDTDNGGGAWTTAGCYGNP